MTARTFRVVYEHDEGGWHVYIPAVKGCRTWGRSIGAAQKNIREALSTCVDVFKNAEKIAATAVFEDDIRVPSKARAVLRKVRDTSARQEALGRQLRERIAQVAKYLTEDGLSLRDSGYILGISQEQVRQILGAAK